MSSDEILGLAPETTLAEGARGSAWERLKRGLRMTHRELFERLDAAVSGRGVLDEEVLEYLEESLIGADVGVEAALEIVEGVRARAGRGVERDVVWLRQALVDEVAVMLLDAPQPPPPSGGPRVTLVVGVNGTGKTTSVAKLARRAQRAGEEVLLVAADTFRAAASEQLEHWGERLGVTVIRQRPGADPGAVVYDGLAAARGRGISHVLVDTAGRLHTKRPLMEELGKVKRIVEREAADWSRQTILVLDATTGQNAVVQAREFSAAVAVDGVLLAKLDGTAKGGMAVAVARELRLPVLYLGVGEGADDLVPYRAREFAAALFR